jgi:hypothetical protein
LTQTLPEEPKTSLPTVEEVEAELTSNTGQPGSSDTAGGNRSE